MAFEGLRGKLRSLASSGSDTAREQAGVRSREAAQAGRRAAGGVAQRAPETGLERGAHPHAPESTRKALARRLNQSGQMRKPIQDANLEPGSDPRFMEAFGRGDATVDSYFGEDEPGGDPLTSFFARGGDQGMEFGPFVEEMVDERDHEGGMYAHEDEREEGLLDDGADLTNYSGVGFRW